MEEPPKTPNLEKLDRYWLFRVSIVSFVGMLVLLEIATPHRDIGLGFIFLFAMGLPAVVQTLIGFASIFGPAFFRLTTRDKWLTVMLASILAIPALGVALFLVIFVESLVSCFRIGLCDPHPLLLFPLVGIAWVGSVTASAASEFFSRKKWWPLSLNPNFNWFV